MKTFRDSASVCKKLLHITFALLAIVLLPACSGRQTGKVVTSSKEEQLDKDAPYVEGNKKILQWENEEIALFVKRYGWKMTKTGTGLYVEILSPGTGENYKEGDKVTLNYHTYLLSGELVYDSNTDGVKEFTVGRSEEITALHEAVQMMNPGAKARLVIPSYLAYGVAGDGDRINGRLPIAMTIELLP